MALSIDSSRDALHAESRVAMRNISSASLRFRRATTPAEAPKIPDPRLFEWRSNAAGGSGASPTVKLPIVAECAAHLELLQVFYVLRQRILKSEALDKVFGTLVIHPTVTLRDGTTKALKDKDFWKRREIKWTKYLEFAVARFLAWRRKGPEIFNSSSLDSFTLPPLDVLMVWHAFLLNPRTYRHKYQDFVIYNLEFPWPKVHEAINNDDWTFALPKTSSGHFENVTGLSSDLFKQLSEWDSPRLDLRNLSIKGSPDISPHILSLKESDPKRRHFEVFHAMNKDFGCLLRDAVTRQTSFVDKMNAHLWIRSPALDGTLRRAMNRYDKFLKLFKLYPSTMFVPTLDIDLVWHTHQCSPAVYFETTNILAGKFLNHDDSIVQDKLDIGFEKTRNLYRIRFADEYRVCGCWDCQALLSELEDPIHSLDGSPDLQAMGKKVIADVEYYRCVEMAKRKKEPLPVRD